MQMHYQLLGRVGRFNVRQYRTVFLAILLCAFSACSLIYPDITDLAPFGQQPTLANLTVAHRGNVSRGELPDNSLPALRQALSAGVPLLEVDVRRANDGSLFLFHDGSFTSSNSNAPRNLRGVPIGEIPSSERNQVTLGNSGSVVVPALADALSLIEQNRAASLQLDLKGESDQLALEVLKLVSTRKLLHRVLVQIRSPERIGVLLKAYPQARILARCRSQQELEQALNYRIEAVELERWITAEAVALAHRHGVLVGINVANSRYDTPEVRGYLRSRGVDLVMTDWGGEK
jgi:glycerophosphoryl diester phosphodiesterase